MKISRRDQQQRMELQNFERGSKGNRQHFVYPAKLNYLHYFQEKYYKNGCLGKFGEGVGMHSPHGHTLSSTPVHNNQTFFYRLH